MTSEIDDRRQRAFEAYADYPHEEGGVENAIEVATQVKITQEAVWAHTAPGEKLRPLSNAEIRDKVADILAALGFEVVD